MKPDDRPSTDYRQPQQVQTIRPDTQVASTGASAQSVTQSFLCIEDERARLRRVSEGS